MDYVGCHISIRNGYAAAARTAVAIGATAFQYFPKNPRGLSIKAFDAADTQACARCCREYGIVTIAHTTYATNLAAVGALREPTLRSLRNDFDIAEACGSIGVVVHFGKWRAGRDPIEGYKTIISAINELLGDWKGKAMLLLENQAGEGHGIGTTLEELASIRQLSAAPERIGFCLDTCHLFASGVWNGSNWNRLLEQGRKLGVIERIRALHLNDSVYGSGSRRDRHANIGKGEIGETPLQQLLRTEEFRDIPVVLETPAHIGISHKEEISYVRTLP